MRKPLRSRHAKPTFEACQEALSAAIAMVSMGSLKARLALHCSSLKMLRMEDQLNEAWEKLVTSGSLRTSF
jgi:hypothetical protein